MTLERDPALASGDPFLLFRNVRQFEIAIDGQNHDVYEFHLEEDLFSSYRAELVIVPERHLSPDDLLRKRVKGSIRGRSSIRYYYGLITEYEELPSRGRYRLFRIVVEPELFALTRSRNIRIFQKMTVPQIVEEVLKGGRIFEGTYTMELAENYAPRDYCVQYRETDMDFMRRIMADEGMFFYHRFKEDKAILVITDTHHFHDPIEGKTRTVNLAAKGELVNFEDHITEFTTVRRVVTEQIHLRDYDYTLVKTCYARAETEKNPLFYEIYDYPGYVLDEKTAQRMARNRLQIETWRRAECSGKGVCRMLAPGHAFTLRPRYAFESDADYIVKRVVHEGKQPQVLRELEESREGTTYGNTFTCIPSDVTFRPQLLPKPSVKGLQSAVVSGPENEVIYTDELGRIKIRFHWDLVGKEELSSCWVRVSQIWAGSGKGCETIFTPRIGQEVLVDFLDGDPDRPVVVGTVFNDKHAPPYNLPVHKTRSTIKTHTVKGEGFNELRFEDLKGKEEIYIHAQKDMNTEILNDRRTAVGHDDKLDITNDRSKTVGHDQKDDIKNDKTIIVGKNHSETIGENMNVKIGKNLDEVTGEDKTVEVGKNYRNTIGEDADIRVKGNETVDVGKNHKSIIGENSTGDVGKDMTVRVGGNASLTVDRNMSASAQEHVTTTAGKNVSITSSGGDVIIRAGGATVTLTKNGDIKLDGANVSVNASGKITMNGTSINQN